MLPTETTRLVALVGVLVPSQKIADYDETIGGGTEEAWHGVLADLRFADCADAVRRLAGRLRRFDGPWIDPAQIRAEVAAIRNERIDKAPPFDPPPGLDPDDVVAFNRARLDYVRRVADGEPAAAAVERPRRDVARAIEGTFQSVPS